MINFWIIFAVGVFLGIFLLQDPGYIQIVLHNFTIETTVLAFLLLNILIFLIVHSILMYFRWLRLCSYRHIVKSQKKSLLQLQDALDVLTKPCDYNGSWDDVLDYLYKLKHCKYCSKLEYSQTEIKYYFLHFNFLVQEHRFDEASLFLKKYLKYNYTEQLMYAYVSLPTSNLEYKFINHMLYKHKNSASAHLGLGKYYIQENLWGKARENLEKSIEICATPLAYLELGDLFALHFREESVSDCYRKGLLTDKIYS